jgi:hypothetical protein
MHFNWISYFIFWTCLNIYILYDLYRKPSFLHGKSSHFFVGLGLLGSTCPRRAYVNGRIQAVANIHEDVGSSRKKWHTQFLLDIPGIPELNGGLQQNQLEMLVSFLLRMISRSWIRLPKILRYLGRSIWLCIGLAHLCLLTFQRRKRMEMAQKIDLRQTWQWTVSHS